MLRRLSLILGSFLLVASCNNVPEAANEQSPSPAPQPKAAVEEENKTVSLELECTDQMKYNTDQLMVEAGQEVTLKLIHVGELDKSVMGHNFVLLKKGTNLADFAAEAVNAKDADYIPNGGADVIAHTTLIGGGESTEISFTAPSAGIYDFICSFPGHYGLMQGKFIVN